MTLWQGAFLGLVQGLTEFLPVSSSGHLVLAEALAGIKTPGVFVEVLLHVATLGSVLIVYGRRLGAVALGVARGRREDVRYALLLVVATVPAGVLGVLLHDAVARAFDSLLFVGVAFGLTGVVLWSTRRVVRAPAAASPSPVPTGLGAVVIGLAQAVAILPGISRSGSTVSAALWCRLEPTRAAEFSFLIAIPVIGGAALLEARGAMADLAAVGALPLGVSCIVALASGIWAIRFLVALLRRGRFYAFAPYCWSVGAFTILYALWRG
ncbi:MAG: undecaprenyl-diphosphate phosphatase [Gemmatimonadales bacterium]